ncbi:hypothetical protein RhiirA5_445802 [Rhizophagus irregularis]|nr:hypothetical protein RhiirA5_445802 [Rhizophagus irregularis]
MEQKMEEKMDKIEQKMETKKSYTCEIKCYHMLVDIRIITLSFTLVLPSYILTSIVPQSINKP